MKRIKLISVICFMLTMVLMTSCSGKQEKSMSIADMYKTTAQEFIAKGDYASAIQALEEGVAATNDEGLVAFLEEVKSNPAAQAGDDKETASAPTDTQQPTPEPTQDVTAEPTPEPTAEPTPVPTPEPPAVVAGAFDNFVGSWQDRDSIGGEGIWLYIGYGDETKQRAYARVATVADEYEVELTIRDDETAYGYIMDGSEPTFSIEISQYKYWLEASIYYADIGEEIYVQFVVNPDIADENPYYVG